MTRNRLLLIAVIIMLIFPVAYSKTYSIDYNNWLTYSMGDSRYCLISGSCSLLNLVVQNLTVEGSYMNVTVIDYNVTNGMSVNGNFSVDSPTLFVDSTANRVGIGTSTVSAPLHVYGDQFPVALIERFSSDTTSDVRSAFRMRSTTNLDMADGFGGGIMFSISDLAATEDIARISAKRDGADDSGALSFETYNAGARSEKMRILPSGNIGIGTTSPEGLLALNGNPSNNAPSILLEGNVEDIAAYSGEHTTFGEYNSSTNTFTEHWRVQTGGNIGMGSNAPNNLLHLKTDTDGEGLTIQRSSVDAGAYADLKFLVSTNDASAPATYIRTYRRTAFGDNDMVFHVGETDIMYLDDSGNVGIGTTAPAHKLEVAGSINVSGDVNISGILYGGSPLDIGSDVIMYHNLNVSGIVNASKYYGDGSGLTGISGSGGGDGTGGWVNDSRSTYTDLDVNVSNNLNIMGSYGSNVIVNSSIPSEPSCPSNFVAYATYSSDINDCENLDRVTVKDTTCSPIPPPGNCWSNGAYKNALFYLPDGLNTTDSINKTLAKTSTSYYINPTECLIGRENYKVHVELVGASSCILDTNDSLYFINESGAFIFDDYGIYHSSTDTKKGILFKSLDSDRPFDMWIDNNNGYINIENGITFPQLSFEQGDIISDNGGHFNLSYTGGTGQKIAYIDLSDDWNDDRPPELKIVLHADKTTYEPKIHLTNSSTTFSTNILFYSNATYNIGSPTQAAKGIYYETAYDLTPGWDTEKDGSAMEAIMNIQTENGEILHSSLPAFAKGVFYCKGDNCLEADSYKSEEEQLSALGISKGNYTKIETRKTNHLLTALVEAQQEMAAEVCKTGNYTWC